MGAALVALLLLQEPSTAPDRLTLTTTGREETVTLRHFGAEHVDYLDGRGQERSVLRKRVRKAIGPRAEYAEFARRFEAAYADVAPRGASYEFALWCRERGYHRDFDLACWRELARAPDHVEAHLALGHLGGPEAWSVPLGDGRTAAWPDALRLHATPELPWRFTTMHATVEVSGPLDRAVIAAAAVELLYARIHDLLRERARLWDLQQPLRVRVWPSRGLGYPARTPGEQGHWDAETGVLHTWWAPDEVPARPLHFERLLAESVLDLSAAEMSRSRADVPYWLSCGLGLVLEASTSWGSGLPSCSPPRIARELVELQAAGAAARNAGQIAILARPDVQGPHAEALRAHCATLLHFLLESRRADFDAAFRAWLVEAMRNRGGGSALRDAFGGRLDDLDAEWRAWVAREGAPRAGQRQ